MRILCFTSALLACVLTTEAAAVHQKPMTLTQLNNEINANTRALANLDAQEAKLEAKLNQVQAAINKKLEADATAKKASEQLAEHLQPKAEKKEEADQTEQTYASSFDVFQGLDGLAGDRQRRNKK